MYVYIRSEPGLWTVGHYDPAGKWVPESDWATAREAGARVHYLNGGSDDAGPATLRGRLVHEPTDD